MRVRFNTFISLAMVQSGAKALTFAISVVAVMGCGYAVIATTYGLLFGDGIPWGFLYYDLQFVLSCGVVWLAYMLICRYQTYEQQKTGVRMLEYELEEAALWEDDDE